MVQYERLRGRTKRCARCGNYKDFSEFYGSKYTKSGCSGWCIDCNRCSKYGITGDEFKILIAKQDGKCATCQTPFDLSKTAMKKNAPHIDHDPTTNIIRGILCHRCNAGLGLFDHRVKILRNASLYMEFYNLERQPRYDNTTHPTV